MVSSSDGADKVPVSKEQEKGRRRKQPEKKQRRLTLRSGRRKYKILREKSRLRRGSLRSRTIFRSRLWQKAKR